MKIFPIALAGIRFGLPGLVSLAVSACAATGLAADDPSGPPAAIAARPNILFILSDDLGYGDLGCYGQTRIRTPHIDRLAAEGMRFTDFYSGATICSPSRSVLLTGQHTGHTRIRGNMATVGGIVGRKGDREVRRMHLTDADRTIGHVLGAAGYRTGVVGKWHVDGFNQAAGPLDRGFDDFWGWLVNEPRTYESTYFPPMRFSGRELRPVPGNQAGEEGAYHPDLCLNEARGFLEANRDRPFFLFLSLNLPHSPYRAPALDPYAEEAWPEVAQHYAAMIDRLDRLVGGLMGTLEDLELTQRTLVLFTSDNGPRSEPEPAQTQAVEFFDSNGPLRGYKRDLSDGGIRVPMIVRWPGVVPADRTSDVPWYFADVLPTLADIAGADVPAAVDGLSMLPTLRGEAQDLSDRFLYWEDFEGAFEQAVRWRAWKAIVPYGGPLRLYDLSTDPGEVRDIAADHPDVVARILEFLSTARTESENWPLPTRP